MPAAPRPPSIEADLAFLRSIVEGGGKPALTLAVAYLAGGLLYGTQCLFHIGQITGVIRWPDLANLIFVVSITVAMCAVLAWAIMKDVKAGNTGPTSSRAMNAGFSAAGMTNVAIIIVFGVGAVREGEFFIWLYYAAMIFALQAAAWFVAWSLRRKTWMLMTALGGWATAIGLGLTVRDVPVYLGICTAALFLLFALPGWIMLRQATARAAEV